MASNKQQLDKAFKDLHEALTLVMKTMDGVIVSSKELQSIFSSAKGIKEYTTALQKLDKNRKESNTLTKQQIDLLKKEEGLKAAAARTTAAQERAIQAKNRTAEQERKIALQQEKQATKLTSAYSRQTKTLTLLRNRAKNLALTYGENSKQFMQAEKRVVSLDNRLKKLDARLGQSQRNVGNYSKSMVGLGKNLIGAFGVVGGIQMFASALKDAFRIQKEYEKANAVLAGVLGKTRKETVLLQKDSKRLGSTTAFSASQVTELQIELARLGKTEAEIVGMTEGIISATIALGSETGETAALVGATLNAWQMEASESSKVADILTLSTQRSALSFSKLNTALPIVAGAAAAAGVSLEETVAQLGKAADRGIDASTAASSLRNIYLELAKSGLTLEEALTKINTSQDKLSTANELFGKRAAVTALALADTTDETKELTKALEDAGGTAEKVANEQLNTLDGKLKLLNSAWEGFILAIGDSETALGRFAKTAVQSATNAIIGITNVGLAAKAAIKGLGALTDDELGQFLNVMQLDDSDVPIIKTLTDLKKKYEELPDIITGVITLQENLTQELVKAGESQEDAVRIVEAYINILNQKNQADKEAAEAIEDQNKELNTQTAIIKSNFKASEARGQIVIGTEHEIQAELVETTKVFQDAEDKKTEILKESEKIRQRLREEFNAQLKDSAISIGNSLFDIKNEQLTEESELIAQEFDTRLAREELDEEQRSLIEAQRTAEENRIAREQRELEKKQFLFNQAVSLAEVGIETAKGVATATAQAPLTFGASLSWIPLILGTGAAQAAAIIAQSIPAFDKGTKSLPGLSEVAEKRPEFVKTSRGVELFTSPTILGNDYTGAEVISGAQTARILDNVSRSEINELSSKGGNPIENALFISALKQTSKDQGDRIVKAINNSRPKKDNSSYRTMAIRDKFRNKA